MEIPLREAGEPLDAVRLIRTKLRPQFCVERGFHVGRWGIGRDIFTGAKTLRGQGSREVGREGPRDANLSRFLSDVAVGEDFLHLAPRLGRHEEHALVWRASMGLAGLEPALDFGLIERDRFALHGKFQIEAQPIIPRP